MTEATDPENLVARAIESVLGAMPVTQEEVPEALVKYQPWADTAAPQGRNKRPLQELLDEIAERVAAEPQARAAVPSGKRPGLAFFDRFVPRRAAPEAEPGRGRGGRSKRRRGRSGDGSRPAEPAARAPQAVGRGQGSQRQEGPAPPAGGTGGSAPGPAGRRRRRRGGGRGGGGAGGGGAPAAP